MPTPPSLSPNNNSDNDINPALPPPPPSGTGTTESAAQHSPVLSRNPFQSHYTVYRQLETPSWLRCTHAEALYYAKMGYRVYKANGQTFRPVGSGLGNGGEEVEDRAFYSQFEGVVRAERVLEQAGVGGGEEGVMGGLGVVDSESGLERDGGASSVSCSSGGGDDVFDKSECGVGDQCSTQNGAKGKIDSCKA